MQCFLKALYPGPWPQQLCSLWETCSRADLNYILGSRWCFSQLATQQLSCQLLEWSTFCLQACRWLLLMLASASSGARGTEGQTVCSPSYRTPVLPLNSFSLQCSPQVSPEPIFNKAQEGEVTYLTRLPSDEPLLQWLYGSYK